MKGIKHRFAFMTPPKDNPPKDSDRVMSCMFCFKRIKFEDLEKHKEKKCTKLHSA